MGGFNGVGGDRGERGYDGVRAGEEKGGGVMV